MSQTPVDPDDDGIPRSADEESSAYDLGGRPSFEDSPAASPGEEPAELPPEQVGPEKEAAPIEGYLNAVAPEPEMASEMASESQIEIIEHDGEVLVDIEPVPMTLSASAVGSPPGDAD